MIKETDTTRWIQLKCDSRAITEIIMLQNCRVPCVVVVWDKIKYADECDAAIGRKHQIKNKTRNSNQSNVNVAACTMNGWMSKRSWLHPNFTIFFLETNAPVSYVNCDIFLLILLFIVFFFSIFLLLCISRRAVAADFSVLLSFFVAVMVRLVMITRNSIDSTAMIRKKKTIVLRKMCLMFKIVCSLRYVWMGVASVWNIIALIPKNANTSTFGSDLHGFAIQFCTIFESEWHNYNTWKKLEAISMLRWRNERKENRIAEIFARRHH